MIHLRKTRDALYALMPVPLQNLGIMAWGYVQRRQRYGPEFHAILEWLRESEHWSAVRIAEYQDEKLHEMVRHAFATVPHYAALMRDRGLSPDDIRSRGDLAKLPVLAKETVRNDPGSFVSTAFRAGELRTSLTSGTTGTPLRVRLTPRALQFQWAVWWRHRARFGLRLGDPFLTFGARLPVPARAAHPPYWRRNPAFGQTYLSTYHLTPATMPAVVEWLNAERFAFFTGYPSAMFVLANFIRERGLPFALPPRWVVSGSDALLPGFRAAIGEAFRAPVTDQYGSAEACGNFAQCEHGRYHLDFEFGIVELLPLAGAGNSRLRRIVFTGLANPAMPFLRYDTGDIGLLAEGPCPCGRASLALERIEGRTEDFVRTPDGRMAVGMNQVFEWAPGILEAQIVQREISRIEVSVVPARTFGGSDLQILEHELRKRLGDEIGIDFHVVPHIARTRAGKFRAVVSHLPAATAEEAEHRAAVAHGIFHPTPGAP